MGPFEVPQGRSRELALLTLPAGASAPTGSRPTLAGLPRRAGLPRLGALPRLAVLLALLGGLSACARSSPGPTAGPTDAGPTPSPRVLPPSRTATPTPAISPTPTPAGVDQLLQLTVTIPVLDEPVDEDEPLPLRSLELLPAGEQILLRELHMFDPQQGWAISYSESVDWHILRTSDGGESWIDVSPPVQALAEEGNYLWARGFFLDPRHAWVVYASLRSGSPGLVWRTADGGKTWDRSLDFLGTVSGVSPASPELFFLDASTGWLQLDAFLGASSYGSDLYHSDDSGERWELVMDEQRQPPSDWIAGGLDGWDFLDGLHGLSTGSHPATSGAEVYWTSDGGGSWLAQVLPSPEEDPGMMGDLNCRGLSPRLFGPGRGLIWVTCRDAERDFVYLTRDTGANWDTRPFPAAFDQTSLVILDENRLVALGWWIEVVDGEVRVSGAELYKSADAGAHWQRMAELDWGGTLEFLDESNGWAFGGSETDPFLLRTTDGGRTWRELASRTGQPMERPTIVEEVPVLPEQRSVLQSANAADIQPLVVLRAEGPTDLGFTPTWDAMITAHEDGWLLHWDLTELGEPWAVHHHHDWVYEIAFDPQGSPMASASKDGTLWYWWLYGGFFLDVGGPAGEVTSVAISEAPLVALGGDDDNVWVVDAESYDPETGEFGQATPLRGHTNWVWDVEYSPDGKILASASADHTVRLWDVEGLSPLSTLSGHAGTVWRLTFSPDGRTLASASWDSTVKLWDVASGRELRTLTHPAPVYSVAYSPDGSLLATGDDQGAIRLWDPASGRLLQTLVQHTDVVRGLEFSPDGSLLGSASADGTIRLWGVPQ
jgi:photosystem II stability/assembly factor-like uncharacterized protein